MPSGLIVGCEYDAAAAAYYWAGGSALQRVDGSSALKRVAKWEAEGKPTLSQILWQCSLSKLLYQVWDCSPALRLSEPWRMREACLLSERQSESI